MRWADGVRFDGFTCLTHHTVYSTGFDIASRYKHKAIPPDSKLTLEELKKGGYVMNEREWLNVSIASGTSVTCDIDFILTS